MSEEINSISEAKKAAMELRQATEELKNQIDRAEKLKIVEILSGKTEAGQIPEKPKEESPQEYAARILAGRY